jgi:hypothetical protein
MSADRIGGLWRICLQISSLLVAIGCEGPIEGPCDSCDADELCIEDKCQPLLPCTSSADCLPGHPCLPIDEARQRLSWLNDPSARYDMATRGPQDLSALDRGDLGGGNGGSDLGSPDGGGSDLGEDMAPSNRMACSPLCETSSCPARQECQGSAGGLLGSCRMVDCGITVPCIDGGVCDAFVNRCYPFNGSCTIDANCPLYDKTVASYFQVGCVDLSCHIGRRQPEIVDLQGVPKIQILAPDPGTAFATESTAAFRWPVAATSVIALILSQPPVQNLDLKRYAIWGAALPPGAPGEVRIGDGQAVENGTWQQRSVSLPTNVPLYFVLQVVRPGELLAVSPTIPFVIGADLSSQHVGDACDSSNMFCSSLTEPLACFHSTCRALCASHRDCVQYLQKCSDVADSRLRLCE